MVRASHTHAAVWHSLHTYLGRLRRRSNLPTITSGRARFSTVGNDAGKKRVHSPKVKSFAFRLSMDASTVRWLVPHGVLVEDSTYEAQAPTATASKTRGRYERWVLAYGTYVVVLYVVGSWRLTATPP